MPEIKEIYLPSPSRIDSFLSCSMKYHFKEQGFEEPKGIDMIIGIAMHFAAAGDALVYIKEGKYTTTSDAVTAGAAVKLKMLFEDEYEYPKKDQEEFKTAELAYLYALGKIKGFSEQYAKAREYISPVDTEREFTAEFSHKDTIIRIRSRVDILTFNSIVDYKFRKKNFKTPQSSDLQLIIYKMLVDHAMNYEYDFTVAQIKENDYSVDSLEILPGQVERAKSIMYKVIQSIESEVWMPAAQNDWRCDYCGYNDRCPYTLHGEEHRKAVNIARGKTPKTRKKK